MYTYKTELLHTKVKNWTGLLDENCAGKLDELINEKAKCDWELVTYSYISTSVNNTGTENAFMVTFRKER